MKSISLLSLLVLLNVSIDAFAQQDTISVPFKKTTQKLFTINANDLPEPVRQTLAKPKYNGWEEGPVYRNLSSNHYVVKITSGRKPKYFSFDETGKPIRNP